MSLKKRRILLLIAIAIFLVLSPLIIFYASGYKYDWQRNRWLKTGAFYFQTYPSKVKVFIDQKSAGETPELTNYLLPGQYSILLKKKNYQTWQKRMTINQGLVTNVSNLILPLKLIKISKVSKNSLPQINNLSDSQSFFFQTSTKIIYQKMGQLKKQYSINPFPGDIHNCRFLTNKNHLIIIAGNGDLYLSKNGKFDKIASGVLAARFTSDGDKFLWWNKNEIWVYYLNSPSSSQSNFRRNNQKLIVRLSRPIKQALWLSPNNQQIFFLADKMVGLVELDSRGGRNNFILHFDPSVQIEKVYWNSNNRQLYLKDKNSQWWTGKIW